MFSTGISKVLSLKNVRPSVRQSLRHITYTKNPCVLVLTRCHVTDINHVLTPCHVIEINYVDRGVAARTPLQLVCAPTHTNPQPNNRTTEQSNHHHRTTERKMHLLPPPSSMVSIQYPNPGGHSFEANDIRLGARASPVLAVNRARFYEWNGKCLERSSRCSYVR